MRGTRRKGLKLVCWYVYRKVSEEDVGVVQPQGPGGIVKEPALVCKGRGQ